MAIPPIRPDQGLARIANAQGQEHSQTPAVVESDNSASSAGAILRSHDLSMGEMVASRTGIIPMPFASSEISKDFQRLDRAPGRRKPGRDDKNSREPVGSEKPEIDEQDDTAASGLS